MPFDRFRGQVGFHRYELNFPIEDYSSRRHSRMLRDIEVPNRLVDMDSRKRSACYPRGSFYPLSPVPPTRDPGITNTDFRPSSACKPHCQAGLMRLHDTPRFPSEVSQPLYASVTFLEATSPVKLPARQCPLPRFLCRDKSDFPILKRGIPLLSRLAAGLPPILDSQNRVLSAKLQ